jgi:hypothetical protein
MTRITSADGRVLREGGGGGPALPAGSLMNVSTGGGDEGPYCLLARVHPDIRRVELMTAAGETLNVTGQVSGSAERDQAAAGIQGWPSVSITRASKKLSPCLAAVDR